MKKEKKTLESFALSKQAISKLQMETVEGGVEDGLTYLFPGCHTHPKLCIINMTNDRYCQNVTVVGCSPIGPTMECTVA
ncbi:hypothetical protein HYN56_16475 [Flavobacterium crocinum]|uniref:Uncharacterized protein n=1 Tax=Flavobacterium crocinum TaxID=2183896 RepID=A0A2S1YNT3_9FLAO|nr:hypothetical protein [Flavobacterium crocinum]AWK05745.1 hypothetical protein HYN56_16475 [Flavobacterium crocinum]